MNKKIFTVLVLLIVVTSIGAVSAFDLGDIFSAGKNETVTLGGVDFNIPAGYKEDSSNTFNVVEGFIADGYKFDGKIYAKDNTQVGIFVYNYSSSDTGYEDFLSNFANETTINNVGGFIEYDENDYIFVYTKDSCIVLIASNDQNAIGDFIIA